MAIWGLWLVGEAGELPPLRTRSTRTLELCWTGGEWELAGPSPGPVPQLGQQASQDTTLPPQLTDFEEYAHAGE